MSDYSKSKIYKIVSLIEGDKNEYIGSTVNTFAYRLNGHKIDCKKNPERRLYKHIIENGGWQYFKMVLLEEYPCENKKQKERKEREWIEKLQPSLNFMIPTRTRKEYKIDHKEHLDEIKKQNYEKNKDVIIKNNYKYYLANKEHIDECRKQWQINNKETVREKAKTLKECDICKCSVRIYEMSRHNKSQKHIKNLADAS